MKIQLIILPQPILVSDEKIKENDFITTCGAIDDGLLTVSKYKNGHLGVGQKIIASIPELPSINLSELSEEDCKKIGWVDDASIDKYCYQKFGYTCSESFSMTHHNTQIKDGFREGFKIAQSLNEKKFSEEDIEDAIEYGKLNNEYQEHGSIYMNVRQEGLAKMSRNIFIQFISQPKVFDIEVEMEEIRHPLETDKVKVPYKKLQPKITDNSIKIIKVL